MKEDLKKLIYIIDNFGVLRYREANDSIIINTPITDRFVDDATMGVMIYKNGDEYRVDDLGFIDDFIDVSDVDFSDPFYKSVLEEIIDSYGLQHEDNHHYYIIPDIDYEYQEIIKNPNLCTYVLKAIFYLYGAMCAVTRINEVMIAYRKMK